MVAKNGKGLNYADRRYTKIAMDAPILAKEYEFDLTRRWKDHNDEEALHEIVMAHVRLVVRIGARFKGYGLPIGDLIQEGNSGLLEAANRFDPERNVRFSTYATWWVMAAMQDYIIKNVSIVRIGTNPAQKRLFFNLRKLRAATTDNLTTRMTTQERERVALALGVPLAAVERMEAFFSGPDHSLNQTLGDNGSKEFIEILTDVAKSPEEVATENIDGETRIKWVNDALDQLSPREREVITKRFLKDEKTTLAEIGAAFGVTKERIRQIEAKALEKLHSALENRGIDGNLGLL